MKVHLLFHAVTFLGSFLLFQIQPIAAKQLLPIYGGSAAVWSACMLFFQLLLLLGYAYSHGAQKCSPRRQMVLHGFLLFGAALLLPATPASSGTQGANPVGSIILSLSCSIGPSFFILSTTSPLIQSWAARCSLPHPYQLYTTSNFASLAALISYPFLVEPRFSATDQFTFWKILFILFSLLCFTASLVASKHKELHAAGPEIFEIPARKSWIGRARVLLPWILWPALGSTLLLGFTSHICRDIAVIPFLWILPLSLYLLSFIFCFARKPFYRPGLFAALFLAASVLYSIPWTGGVRAPAYLGIAVCSITLFLGVMIAHGELVRNRPHATQLTGFYLCMSLGGALGGLLVTLIAPFLFQSYFELPLAMSILATICLFRLRQEHRSRVLLSYGAMTAQALVLAFAIIPPFMNRSSVLYQKRNFYGVIKVREAGETIALTDGRIEHGNMYRATSRQSEPLGYYSPNSGIGQALDSFPAGMGRKVGVIGVGAGTVCAYARPGDEWWLFELNPAVQTAAVEYFHFLKAIPGPYQFRVGDGRLQLLQSGAFNFDLIMLDAFSSDSVPVHLLTREAFNLYLSRLKPEGLIVAHITNGHLNFEPLVAALGRDLGLHVKIIQSTGDGKERYPASYAIFSRNAWLPARCENSNIMNPVPKPGLRLWTDDYSNIFQLMKNPL